MKNVETVKKVILNTKAKKEFMPILNSAVRHKRFGTLFKERWSINHAYDDEYHVCFDFQVIAPLTYEELKTLKNYLRRKKDNETKL